MIKRAQESDPESQGAAVAASQTPNKSNWSLDAQGLLRKNGRVFVPSESTLRRALLPDHDEPVAGHFGKSRTFQVLHDKFWWKNMAQNVAEFVASCPVSQRSKSRRHQPYGELQPPLIPKEPWQEVSINFIVGLPPVFNGQEEVDSILVVVNRLTKTVRFLPTASTITAVELDELLLLGGVAKIWPAKGYCHGPWLGFHKPILGGGMRNIAD